MRGGDVALNMQTGEARIVVAYDGARDMVTFCRDPKWYAAGDWRTSLAAPHKGTDERGASDK